jgi:hypothetical protein
MAHDLQCWKCGAALAELSLPLRRLDECPKCHSELHVCKLCVDYDTGKAKHCREPIAEEVSDKEHAYRRTWTSAPKRVQRWTICSGNRQCGL